MSVPSVPGVPGHSRHTPSRAVCRVPVGARHGTRRVWVGKRDRERVCRARHGLVN